MSLSGAARRAWRLMRDRSLRVVTAESCTAGLVAASLAQNAGVSEFLCGGLVVYRNATKAAYLGVPRKLLDGVGPVSGEVCEWMARAALDKTPEADVSVSVTGHLGPGAPEGFDGVVYVGAARRTGRAKSRYNVHVSKAMLAPASRLTRQKQAAIVALEMLSDMLAMPGPGDWPSGIELTEREWGELVFGEIDAVCVGGPEMDGERQSPTVIYPGSFHPLHEGHRRLAAWTKAHYGRDAEFEISILNVDKPPIDFRQAIERLRQFEPGDAVWLTRAPTFLDKSAIFPGAVFVVGADTMKRIGDKRYYPGGAEELRAAVQAIAERGCRFLVFGRKVRTRFLTLADLSLPGALRTLCEPAPRDQRIDIASRDLRKGG
jgi:PncC family amidohydrolase